MVRNNKRRGKNAVETPATPGARRIVRTSSGGTDGPYHSTRRGWKHQEPLGGGPVGESEWTHPDAGLAGAHGWRRQQTVWYYIETRTAHQAQFNRANRTNCQQDSQPLPKDLLLREDYAAGFKLDQWGRFHELDGSETDQAYERVWILQKRYQGQGEGQPMGPPSTIRLPDTKGTMPDKDTTLTESELAGCERGESGPEEGEVQQEEGDDPGSFTKIQSRETDTESEDTTSGRESWMSARGREKVLPTTPWPQGRGKCPMDRGGGAAKRPRTQSRPSPGPAVPRSNRGEVVGRLPDP